MQAIAGNNCSTMTLVSPGLQARLCLCLQFSTGSNYYRMNSKALLFEGFFKLAKEQGLLRFSFDDMEWIHRHMLLYLSSTKAELSKQNPRSRTDTTNYKTETQTCGNRTTPRLLRHLLNFSRQHVDSNQLEIINGKKRFSLITLHKINLFS